MQVLVADNNADNLRLCGASTAGASRGFPSYGDCGWQQGSNELPCGSC
jgi:hypothetical protein